MGLRRFLRRRTDRELNIANSIGTGNQSRIELNLRYGREVSVQEFQEASETMVVATVARAVARERTGSSDGHYDLTDDMRVAPKKEWRLFGRWIVGKRGVER
jgi:hypothetical protein